MELTKRITTITILNRLETIFSRFGVPRQLITDNGPSFTSENFNSKLKALNIQHITTSPYNPRCNGLAERAIGTLKRRYYATKKTNMHPQKAINNVLLMYRATVHSSTKESPANLFLKRNLPTPLSWLKTKPADFMDATETNPTKEFTASDKVWVKNQILPGWRTGEITNRTGL